MKNLELYYPLKAGIITQLFGQTAFLSYYKANGVNFDGHNGIDFVGKHGDPIRASHDGYAYYQVDSGGGHGVVLITKEGFGVTNTFYKTIYWHMADPDKEPQFASPIRGHDGIEVKTGDIIGYLDNTGLSTGDHLHFGLKPVAKGESVGTWYNLEQNNGYYGAIDPAPYFNGKFADEVNNFKFNTNMHFGQRSNDIVELQKRLQKEEYFPKGQECTGYYGIITMNAVWSYLIWKGIKPNYVGFYCGPKCREALNS